MRVLLGLLAYLAAVVAIVSGAAAVFSPTSEPSASKASARPEPPRIQAWLDRKAEGVVYAERERAAAQADRERTDELRAKLAATPQQPYVAPSAQEARAQVIEERRAAERERAARANKAERERGARAKESANKREVRRRQRDLEARTAYSYAPEPQRSSYTDDFLTRRDRYGY